jgi:hypothetical protein
MSSRAEEFHLRALPGEAIAGRRPRAVRLDLCPRRQGDADRQEWSSESNHGLRSEMPAIQIEPGAAVPKHNALTCITGSWLSALWDAAFDCGLISFADDSTVLANSQLSQTAQTALGPAAHRALLDCEMHTGKTRRSTGLVTVLTDK